tara:strand:+ start:4916 stop:5077 length:162 start_codon:yes stop_codon:yes gene_type:complete
MKTGDIVKVVWLDGAELVGVYLREERGYVIIESDKQIVSCLPSSLKTVEKIEK